VLFVDFHLGKRAAVAFAWNEHRVVPEPARAALALGDRTLAHAFGEHLAAVGIRHERNGTKACGARRGRHIAQRVEHLGAVVGISGVLACESRGVHAGRAVQRVDFETRVVGDCSKPGGCTDPAGLQSRVAEQRVGVFDDVTDRLGSRQQVGDAAQQVTDLGHLVGVRRGADETNHARTVLTACELTRAVSAAPR